MVYRQHTRTFVLAVGSPGTAGTHRRKRVQPGLRGVRATQRLINNNRLSRILEFLARLHFSPFTPGAANLRLSGIYGAHSFITLIRFCFSSGASTAEHEAKHLLGVF